MFKVIQQTQALRVALYVLKKNGFDAPKKKHVLNFIRLKHLLEFPETELTKRHGKDVDEIWANDIAWKRKNLFSNGEIDSPERGHWRLTEAGLNRIEEGKGKWLKFENPDNRKEFLEALDYCTPELLDWMVKIAKGQGLNLRTTQ